ncbi:hypothetical protein [Zooshikella sp. RANM57]|uniref:hypothetical protein n=1 Tax=Zooshikella sp. RANM57 TaxID=3425863 RepID=UPI003D6EBF78
MNKTYSVWALEGEDIGHTLMEGEDPLQFHNGEVDEECEVRLYSFEAASHEEAMSIYYLRQGWAPYKPEVSQPLAPIAVLCTIPKAAVSAGVVSTIISVCITSSSNLLRLSWSYDVKQGGRLTSA